MALASAVFGRLSTAPVCPCSGGSSCAAPAPSAVLEHPVVAAAVASTGAGTGDHRRSWATMTVLVSPPGKRTRNRCWFAQTTCPGWRHTTCLAAPGAQQLCAANEIMTVSPACGGLSVGTGATAAAGAAAACAAAPAPPVRRRLRRDGPPQALRSSFDDMLRPLDIVPLLCVPPAIATTTSRASSHRGDPPTSALTDDPAWRTARGPRGVAGCARAAGLFDLTISRG